MPICERSKVFGCSGKGVILILGLFLISAFDISKYDMTLLTAVNEPFKFCVLPISFLLYDAKYKLFRIELVKIKQF